METSASLVTLTATLFQNVSTLTQLIGSHLPDLEDELRESLIQKAQFLADSSVQLTKSAEGLAQMIQQEQLKGEGRE
jgi:hypothetical protein